MTAVAPSKGVSKWPQLLVFEQAENRMHAQKALLLMLLGGAKRFANSRARNNHARKSADRS